MRSPTAIVVVVIAVSVAVAVEVEVEVDVDWFKNKQPSSENIVIWMWGEIEKDLKEGSLHKIRLVETHSIYTDYYGPS